MRTINTAYHFRSFPLAVSGLAAGIKPATQEQRSALAANPEAFELAKADFTATDKSLHSLDSACRKSVQAVVNVPELADIPSNSPLLASLIEKHVLSYVKANFIDKYLTVGAHDWDTLEKAYQASLESTGGFAACPYSDEEFKAVQAVFTAWLDKISPKLAAATAKLITNRAAKRQVQSALADFSYNEKTLTKLLERMIECASTQPEDSTVSKVLTYCAERVEVLIEAERTSALSEDDM